MTHDILVIGGAGYIGSHMLHCLKQAGLKPVVLDNLVSGHREAIGTAELIVGDIGDAALLDSLFAKRRFAGVMHFASHIQVGESVTDPGKYYDNNLARTITLLNAMTHHKVGPLIFSSTAAIFGIPDYTPIDEKHPARPINPYGRAKWMVEQLLADYVSAYGLRAACLRYFNAAGADPDGMIGECHEPETHLIPLILQTASGRRAHIKIFGQDYATPDGTCIRDYIHVCDLADAHLLALDILRHSDTPLLQLNLGTGQGYSVAEVIETAQSVTGRHIKVINDSRRHGDPAILVADGSAARALGWRPALSDLRTILSHAWSWEQSATREMAA